MKNILHISCDEKFIDMGINAFELAFPNCNKLLLVTDNTDIKHVIFAKREVVSKKDLGGSNKNSDFWKGVDVVVLHSLFTFDLRIPNGIRVIWLGFGYDYYDFIFDNKAELLSAKNKAFLDKVLINQASYKTKVKNLLKALLLHEKRKSRKRRKIIERVDIFCPVLTSEYDAINWPTSKKPKLMDWNYGTMEDNWAKEGSHRVNGNNVLLGNSATITCNHIDGIDLINQFEHNFKGKLIIPLSYGNQTYKELIKDYLRSNFNGQSQVLEEFMPFDEYSKLISTCSLVVMPHKRQQGLGNILMLLNSGAKVFLDKDNLLYKYLKDMGFVVYSLDEITLNSLHDKLSEQQIEDNRRLLYKIWGREAIIEKTITLVEGELA